MKSLLLIFTLIFAAVGLANSSSNANFTREKVGKSHPNVSQPTAVQAPKDDKKIEKKLPKKHRPESRNQSNDVKLPDDVRNPRAE